MRFFFFFVYESLCIFPSLQSSRLFRSSISRSFPVAAASTYDFIARSKESIASKWTSVPSNLARCIGLILLLPPVGANPHPVAPDFLRCHTEYGKDLRLEDCRGAWDMMPRGIFLVEYYDHEPWLSGWPAIRVPIQYPIVGQTAKHPPWVFTRILQNKADCLRTHR